MPVVIRDRPEQPPGLAIWRVLVWAMLLLAALGCVQYVRHAQQVWKQLRTLAPAEPQVVTTLHDMLGWDMAYLLAALALIVICAGCILRQAWARPCMRVAALLLAVGLVFSATLLLFKGVAVPLLLWLSWRLGQPAVLAQFRLHR